MTRLNQEVAWLNTPAFAAVSPINIDGNAGRRLMTVYRTVGCEYDRKGTGCTMCDFALYANPDIRATHIQAQHRSSLQSLAAEQAGQFDLLTLGNFYNDRELSPELRTSLLEAVAGVSGVKRVLTEARRQYVTVDKLREARRCLRNDQTLEYALGYETVNPQVRNIVLRKGTPERHLDECMQMCRDAGVEFVSYVLIKPHTLSEAEGIAEAVATAMHVLSKAEVHGVSARIAFEPVFVTHGKALEDLFLRGEYVPPKLWSVAEVLIQTANRLGRDNTRGKLFVGLSDENLSSNRMTSNGCVCDPEIRAEIQAFNGHQDVSRLRELFHECKREWEREVQGRCN